jgi:hypothetical protein
MYVRAQPIQSFTAHTYNSCRLPGRDIFNERAANPNTTTTTATTPAEGEGKGQTRRALGAPASYDIAGGSSSSGTPPYRASFSMRSGPSFALGLLVGTLGALSLVFGLRRVQQGGGGGSRYRYAARYAGGGRHHVLP